MANENNSAPVLNEVQKSYLDNMNWPALEEKFGITRAEVEANEKVAAALADFRVAGPLKIQNEKMSGDVFLRAYYKPAGEGETKRPYTVTADLREEKKTLDEYFSLNFNRKALAEKGYCFGNTPILSREAMQNMLAITSWIGADGKTKSGPAYANAGRPISRIVGREKEDVRKTSYLVGYDPRVNKFYGTAVKDVKAYLNHGGNRFYGITLSDEQCAAIAAGGIIGVTLQNGDKVYGQYDPIRHDIVAVHPLGLREVESIVVSTAAEQQKATEKVEKTSKKAEKAAEKKAPEAEKKPAKKARVKKSV